MIFNKNNNGAQELRDLTGNYYANNDFNKIKSDIKSASYYLTKVIGDDVYVRAIDAYQKNEESGTAEGQIADVPKFIELVQRPIAIMATLQMYRKNDVSHEDSGRKVVVTSDGTDKIPWEWQLDRDDAIHMEEYYQAVEQLIDYLNKTQLKEWMESEQKKLADALLIRSGREFDKYLGFAVGAILIRSSPASSAIFIASFADITPTCSPSAPITRTSLSLICSLIIKSLMVVHLHKKIKKWIA